MGKKKKAPERKPLARANRRVAKKTAKKPKRDNKKMTKEAMEEANQKAKSEPSANSLAGKNVLTLLPVPNAKKLPPRNDDNAKLYDAVTKQKEDYKYFIALLRDGAFLSSACPASGLFTQNEFMAMLQKGAYDINHSQGSQIQDTLFTRLYIDFTRTMGITKAEAEAEIYSTDKKFWLTHGPARLLGEEWRDDPDKKVVHSHQGSIAHIIDPKKEDKDDDPDMLLLDDEMVHGALEELAGTGLISLGEDYHIAKRIAAGEILSDDELELLEDDISTGSDGVLELDGEGMPKLLPGPKQGD